MKKRSIKKVVLAYSGGLDTSAIIPWLKENYTDCEVIAFVANIGQGQEDLVGIEEKARLSGASSCYVIDLRDTFITDYVYPILQTGALYEGNYLLGTAMARPLIAKTQVELAQKLGADALAHGATGKGNDQVRFESVYAALAPELTIIAPWREWEMTSRESLIDYLQYHHIPTTVSLEKIYSRDANVWHISTEGGVLEDPWQTANQACWIWTTDPINAPEQPENITVSIEKGVVVAINGQNVSPLMGLIRLNELGARHGIGRIDIVENRLVGMKSRGCYETPGGTLIMVALRAIEQLVLDRESYQWRQQLGLAMSYVVYDGRWFTPYCQALLASANVLTQSVTGDVVITLYKGQATVIQKRSINSLYSAQFATFGEDSVYHQSDATGFIRLHTLTSRIRAVKASKRNSE